MQRMQSRLAAAEAEAEAAGLRRALATASSGLQLAVNSLAEADAQAAALHDRLDSAQQQLREVQAGLQAAGGHPTAVQLAEDAEEDEKQQQFKAILSQLRPDNLERSIQQLLDVGVTEAKTLIGLTAQVYDGALLQPELYSTLCYVLQRKLPEFEDPDCSKEPGKHRRKVSFLRLLLNKCQEEFERNHATREPHNEQDADTHMRSLDSITLMAHLYRMGLLTPNMMHNCVQCLLADDKNPRAVDIDCLCKLLTVVGHQLEHPKVLGRAGMTAAQLAQAQEDATKQSRSMMNAYFTRIRRMSELDDDDVLERRLRDELAGLVALRARGWQPQAAPTAAALAETGGWGSE